MPYSKSKQCQLNQLLQPPRSNFKAVLSDCQLSLAKLGERKGNGCVIEFLMTWLGLPEQAAVTIIHNLASISKKVWKNGNPCELAFSLPNLLNIGKRTTIRKTYWVIDESINHACQYLSEMPPCMCVFYSSAGHLQIVGAQGTLRPLLPVLYSTTVSI